MHNKLRRRFFIISWILLLLFLAALSTGVSVYMYQSAQDKTTTALRSALESREITDKTRGMISFRLNEHGEISDAEQSHISLSDETLETLVKSIEIKARENTGKLELDGMQYQ